VGSSDSLEKDARAYQIGPEGGLQGAVIETFA